MEDKKLREALGVYQSIAFSGLTTSQSGYIGQIFARLTKLEDMMNKLFDELGYEYQTQCSEGLPKLKKKTEKEDG